MILAHLFVFFLVLSEGIVDSRTVDILALK